MKPRPKAACGICVITACAAFMSACSNDGGFFPGGITHNEGAVDYRVAPITYDLSSDRLVSLGGADRSPYVQEGKADLLRTFNRARETPELTALRYVLEEKRKNERQVQDVVTDARARVDSATAARNDAERDNNVAQAAADQAKFNVDSYRTDRIAEPPNWTEDETKTHADLQSAATKSAEAAANSKRTLDAREAEVVQAEQALRSCLTQLDTAKAETAAALNAYREHYASVQDQARKGEIEYESVHSVRVTLKQAFMREFIEAGPVGEVAVLMTVKESRTGLGQEEPRAGRVVYYSEGVRESAYLNFRDQPVYGPIRYGGDDLQIRISILELDEKDNAIAGAILKTVASIGSVAYPPSSPVLASLDRIGHSLLALNGPDLEWDYLMRLSARPPKDAPANDRWRGTYDAWLRDGYYVLVRSDVSTHLPTRERISQDEWNNLYLDVSTGVLNTPLAGPTGEPPRYTPYVARSYLVFTVQTGFDSAQLDLAQEAAELSAVLDAYSGGADSLGEAARVLSSSLSDTIRKVAERRLQERVHGGDK